MRNTTIRSILALTLAMVFLLTACQTVYENVTIDFGDPFDYDATPRIEKAQKLYDTTEDKVDVLGKTPAIQRKIALTFEGMSDPVTMQLLLELLEEHNVKATFFLDGISVVEDPDTIAAIKRGGHTLGNYALKGEKSLEEKSDDDLIATICKGQEILKAVSGKEPEYFKGNSTQYEDNVLKAAWCSGLQTAVEASVYLSETSLKSQSEAGGFVRTLEAGSIVSVKLIEVLDEMEYKVEKEVILRPKDPTLPGSEEAPPEPIDILTMVGYLLEALEEQKVSVVPLHRLKVYRDPLVYSGFLPRSETESYQVLKTVDVGRQHFSSALFVGDSLTEAMRTSSEGLGNTASFCVYPSLSPRAVLERQGEGSYLEEMSSYSPQSIYLLFGMDLMLDSKLGQPDESTSKPDIQLLQAQSGETAQRLGDLLTPERQKTFLEDYGSLLDELNQRFPDADIYVQSLPAVTEDALQGYGPDLNQLLQKLNLDLAKLTEEKECYFIDLYSLFADAGGNRPRELAQADGVLLNNEAVRDWRVSLSTHVAGAELSEDQFYEGSNLSIDQVESARGSNRGAMASPINNLRVVQDTVGLSIYGISDSAELTNVINALRGMGASATFFVSEADLIQYPNQVQLIKNSGFELGIAYLVKDGATFESVYDSLYTTRLLMQQSYGTTPQFVLQPYGSPNPAVREAISALGMRMAGHDVAFVKTQISPQASAQTVMNALFKETFISMRQGQIAYLQLGYYTNPSTSGQLLRLWKEQKIDNIAYRPTSGKAGLQNGPTYQIVGLGKLMSGGGFYGYPVGAVSETANRIYSGQLAGKNAIDEIQKRYIGTYWVNAPENLPGFATQEIRGMDYSGVVHTSNNVIFLTFDDWGYDASLEPLLHVMEKHGVTGTFFVVTQYVPDNPNLLRKIALKGHGIASHTHTHYKLSNTTSNPHIYAELSLEQDRELQQDVIQSYQVLQSIIGDVVVNGRPSLTRMFRPPTLAVSRSGMEMLLDSGYTYIVSGLSSTHDYESPSAQHLANSIRSSLYDDRGNLIKGNILVMHMTMDAKYTAEALDILLTENAAKPAGDPTKFVVGDLRDYLKGGYAQEAVTPLAPIYEEAPPKRPMISED